VESGEFEAEQPARHLTGLPKLVVSVAAVAAGLDPDRDIGRQQLGWARACRRSRTAP
jgi:hypothetical protein